MENKALLVLCAFSILLFCSCSKEKGDGTYTTADFLIVGRAGGFVQYFGPYYKITLSLLSEDSTRYNGSVLVPVDATGFNFSFTLPQARYDTVRSLLTAIPTELFNKNNADIGDFCPDFGYTDVRASVNGVMYKWSFECDQSKSSITVQQFVQKLRADF
jgi:hypothetical protein